jgi:crotonobetainyl-CoA:carnitine CoA-transferase CaiB-like acyl-CoA transferase
VLPDDGGTRVSQVQPPLAGVRIIECSMLGPAAITAPLVDLGAEVVKVESPAGDYIRDMTWPIVEGVSLMHLHVNRGKRSLVLDLRLPEAVEVFKELCRDADVVIEAMRPGVLAKRGVGYEQLREINPRIVFCTLSGYGATGPYRDMPSHGVAYDTWAGVIKPAHTEDGHPYLPEHASIGIHAGPMFGALGVLAAVIRARETGVGSQIDVAQSDAAASMDWLRSESWKAYERPESEVTGNKSDNYERRLPGTAGMEKGVRYQIYASSDGYVLFMASEQSLWKNFCEAVGRPELFEKWPGSKFADHAVGNVEMRGELRDIFLTRTSKEWIAFGNEANTPIAPVNTPKTIADDPQFQHRLGFIPAERLGADQLPSPIKFVGEELPLPAKAPTVGQHSEDVLRSLLGYDDERIAALRKAGAIGAA